MDNTTQTAELPAHVIREVTGLPPELHNEKPVWEVVTSPGHRRPMTARRVYADGRFFSWSNKRRMKGPDGMPKRVDAPFAWRLDARVNEAAVSKIRQLVADQFAQLSSSPLPAGTDASRYPLITWRAFPGGTEHAVVTPSTAKQDELPAVIREIEQAIHAGTVSEGVPLDQPQ